MAKKGLTSGWTLPLFAHSPSSVSLPLTAHGFSRNPVSFPGHFLSPHGSFNPSCLRKKGTGVGGLQRAIGSRAPSHLIGGGLYNSPLYNQESRLKCNLIWEPRARIIFSSEHPGEAGLTSFSRQGVWMPALFIQQILASRSAPLLPSLPMGMEGKRISF